MLRCRSARGRDCVPAGKRAAPDGSCHIRARAGSCAPSVTGLPWTPGSLRSPRPSALVKLFSSRCREKAPTRVGIGAGAPRLRRAHRACEILLKRRPSVYHVGPRPRSPAATRCGSHRAFSSRPGGLGRPENPAGRVSRQRLLHVFNNPIRAGGAMLQEFRESRSGQGLSQRSPIASDLSLLSLPRSATRTAPVARAARTPPR